MNLFRVCSRVNSMRITLLAILLITFLSACTKDGSSSDEKPVTPKNEAPTAKTVSEAISKLQELGHLPKLDRSTTLGGIDDDENGIRDDIDKYIFSLKLSPTQSKAMKVAATTLQSIQLMDLDDSNLLKTINKEIEQSAVCISIAFDNPLDSYKYLKTLEGYTANTPKRAQKYIKYNIGEDGTVTRLPSDEGCK